MTNDPAASATHPTPSYDVIVVGSGGAGLASAYFAAKAGLQALVLERADVLGGTTAYSGGGMWLPGSAAMARSGVEDSTELAREYLTALLGDYEVERREAFLTTAPVALAALEADEHIEIQHQPFPDYFAKPGRQDQGRSQHPTDVSSEELGTLSDGRVIEELVRPAIDDDFNQTGKRRRNLQGGRALIGRFVKAFDATGNGTVVTGARLVDLAQDNRRVTGVIVETATGRTTYHASRGVILAAGGFEGNQELRDKFQTPGAAAWTLGPRDTNEGEAHTAAAAVGAALDLMDQAWWSPGVARADGGAMFSLGFRSGFFVDSSGRRFGNEMLPYDQGGRQLNAEPGRVPAWFVFDSREGGGVPAICLPTPDPAACVESGAWVNADSVAELATQMGLPAEALETSVARYNELAELGEDSDFGRGEDVYQRYFLFDPSAGKNPALPLLDNPPYYAARLVVADLGTKGGVVTDVDARALRPDGSVIEGLYAVGNTAAAWSKDVYPGPGTPIGTGVVFGYRAVQSLVASTS